MLPAIMTALKLEIAGPNARQRAEARTPGVIDYGMNRGVNDGDFALLR